MSTFETKMKKIFEIDLEIYLKEELDLKSRCLFTLTGSVMPECGHWTNAQMWANIAP